MLPVRSISRVWHVGDLRKPMPTYNFPGLEGNGLAVSHHPESWRRIARLGDSSTWRLTKTCGVFLSYYDIRSDLWRKIEAWAEAVGYVVRGEIHRVEWYSDDVGRPLGYARYSLFRTEQEARKELEGGVYSKETAFIPADRLNEWYSMITGREGKSCPLLLTRHMVVFLLAQEAGTMDGVWWDEELNVEDLSAPRGCIFQKSMPTWSVEIEHTTS